MLEVMGNIVQFVVGFILIKRKVIYLVVIGVNVLRFGNQFYFVQYWILCNGFEKGCFFVEFIIMLVEGGG